MRQKIEQPYTFDKVVRLLISIFAIGISLFLLYKLRGVLLPFFVAWLFAYLLNPIVRFLKRRLRFSQALAVITTLFMCLGVVFLLGLVLIPIIEEEIWHINTLITNYKFSGLAEEGLPADIVSAIVSYIDFESIRNSLSKENLAEIINHLSPALEMVFTNTIAVLVGVTVFFLIMLYLIFIMLDYDKINELWQFMIPPKHRKRVLGIVKDVEGNMNKYFRHQALICLILAALYAIGFQLIGLPIAILFGIIVGLVHMIPYLQVVTFPPAILLCWLGSSQTETGFWTMIALTALIYVVVQIIMDLFLVPKIMGKAMGLNPAIILLSLSVWGSLLGIVGMIIAIPLTTLILSYYKDFIERAELDAQASVEDNISMGEVD